MLPRPSPNGRRYLTFDQGRHSQGIDPTSREARGAVEARILDYYLGAKEYVQKEGYWREIAIQESSSPHAVTESQFLQELAWVILSAGMSERVVRGVFDAISSSFLNWKAARLISVSRRRCIERALLHFGHVAKIESIARNCCLVAKK